MTRSRDTVIVRRTPLARILRVVLYAVLILAALAYLMPLVVMLLTSIKPLEEITPGNLLGNAPGADPGALGQGVGRSLHRHAL